MRVKVFILVFLSLFLIFLFVAAYFAFFDVKKKDILIYSGSSGNGKILTTDEKKINKECITSEEDRIVKGDSLSGIISDGEKVRILNDYYLCNDILREDIVVYKYQGLDNPVIKIVKGIPGDSFKIENSGGDFLIYINGKVLSNSLGEIYRIKESASKMIQLYAKDYPVIPQNAFLLLGNLASGSVDSTKFGLIDRKDLIGKVIY